MFFLDFVSSFFVALQFFFMLYHPRQPLMGDLKMHFRFGARVFTAASNLGLKWTPCVPTFGANSGYTTAIVDKFFVARLEGESGKGIHRNLQNNGKLTLFFCLQQLHCPLDSVNLGWNSVLDWGQLTRLFLFISTEICILLLYLAYLCLLASSSAITAGLSLKESFVACNSWSGLV